MIQSLPGTDTTSTLTQPMHASEESMMTCLPPYSSTPSLSGSLTRTGMPPYVPHHTPPPRVSRPERDNTLILMQQFERVVSSVAHLIDSIVRLVNRNDGMRPAPYSPPPPNGIPAGSGTSINPPLLEESSTSSPIGCECPESSTSPLRKGRSLSGKGEFLWKPVSDRDGKLAILLPSSLTGKVRSVSIVSPNAKTVLETGTFTGVGNGDRTHFRFKHEGEHYPDKSIVLITLTDNSRRHVVISDTAKRITK